MNLDSIGLKYNTDKASKLEYNEKYIQGHDYLKYYEFFLRDLIDEEFALIELGCYTGASLRMWNEYLPNAQIIGVDLNSNLKDILERENINFICSNATADDLPDKILKEAKFNIKCIIDDCSHAWGDQRYSFEMLFPILGNGGYYIIEDLECGANGAYPSFPPKILDSQLFFDYALDRMRILRVSENRKPEKFRPYFQELPKHIQEIEKSIDMAIIIPGAVVFRKK